MPVSKKRKKKRSSGSAGPPPPRTGTEVAPRKKKLTKQQIAIYVFSILVILSLALSYLVSNNNPATPASNPADQGVVSPTTAPDSSTETEKEDTTEGESAPSETSPEPTAATE